MIEESEEACVRYMHVSEPMQPHDLVQIPWDRSRHTDNRIPSDCRRPCQQLRAERKCRGCGPLIQIIASSRVCSVDVAYCVCDEFNMFSMTELLPRVRKERAREPTLEPHV